MNAIAFTPIFGILGGTSPELDAMPGVVEQDDFPGLRQAVGHRRIPIVHCAPEVLVEDDRNASRLAEATIGEADAIRLDELGRRGLVRMRCHGGVLKR